MRDPGCPWQRAIPPCDVKQGFSLKQIMRIPVSWLAQFLDVQIDLEQVIKTLGNLGIEVEAVEHLQPHFSGVIVVKVLQVTAVDNGLYSATIWDGTQQHTVVTADSSIQAKQHLAWARPGARLASSETPVSTRYFDTTASEGLLCSAAELGLEARSDTLLRLSQRDTPGMDLAALCHEQVLTLSLTPNLGHCFSILGIARELASALKLSLNDHLYASRWPEMPLGTPPIVSDPQACSAYHLVRCKIDHYDPLPFLWQKRLWDCGQRPISALVDATNLVMLERGQPMHVFDGKTVKGALSVRMGKSTERLQALNDCQVAVAECLIIADTEIPQALAGVMGGSHSAVTPHSTEILLEVADFSPLAVRKSAKQSGLRSESSLRFERGIDPQGQAAAFIRWAELLQLDADHVIERQSYQQQKPAAAITIATADINRLLGTEIAQQEVIELLQSAFAYVSEQKHSLIVTPASWRNDLREPVDLVEEVARLLGYDKLPRPQPRFSISASGSAQRYKNIERLRDLLTAAGLQEWITCSLISAEQAQLLGKPAQSLLHYSSEEHSQLRPSLLPGMLNCLKHNQSRQWSSIASFEIGATWQLADALTETTTLALCVWGCQQPLGWQQSSAPWDFYALTGILETMLHTLQLPELCLTSSHYAWLHPGRQSHLSCNETRLGTLGELHPSYADSLGLQGRVIVAELDLATMLDLMELQQPAQCAAPPLFPGVARDLTLTLQRGTSLAVVEHVIKELHLTHLKGWQLMSIFDPPDKPEQFAATWRLWYRSDNQTLTSDMVDEAQAVLVQKIMSALASVEV